MSESQPQATIDSSTEPESPQSFERRPELRFRHLTAFQQQMLIELADAGGSNYGLGVKRDLEDYYADEDVNHGRLYPNLDTLVEEGFVKKGEQDRRTNNYALTETAKQVLVDEHRRQGEKLDGLRE